MDPASDLLAVRRHKLDALRAQAVGPYGQRFDVEGSDRKGRGSVRRRSASRRAAGRITAHRDMGKSHFLDLSDFSGRIQIFVHPKEIGEEALGIFKQLDIGDWIGVEGEYFLTKTGERTIRIKNLRSLPSRCGRCRKSGTASRILKQVRQRYLDLIANQQSRDVFRKRVLIIREIRRFLEQRGFVEVETPMMQPIAGGAAAQPFKTHHNALGMDLYLRIAPELYLKRLLVAGLTKVFELNRNFRNEGISRRHDPEFTMLEAYWAFADFEMMAALVEE